MWYGQFHVTNKNLFTPLVLSSQLCPAHGTACIVGALNTRFCLWWGGFCFAWLFICNYVIVSKPCESDKIWFRCRLLRTKNGSNSLLSGRSGGCNLPKRVNDDSEVPIRCSRGKATGAFAQLKTATRHPFSDRQ